MKRLYVGLPVDLHRRFKITCTLEGNDMSEVIRRFVEAYVGKAEKRKLIVIRPETCATA